LDNVAAKVLAGISNLAEELLAAGETTPVEQAHRQFGIPSIDLVTFLWSMDRLADPEPVIPKIAQEDCQRLLNGKLSLFVPCEDQQIDIGIREKLAAAISSDRDQGHFRR